MRRAESSTEESLQVGKNSDSDSFENAEATSWKSATRFVIKDGEMSEGGLLRKGGEVK